MLALVTTAFAAAWSGDQQSQAAFALARRDARQQQRIGSALASSPTPVHKQVAVPKSSPRTSLRRVAALMELPADIAPGRYLVVESSGRVLKIIVADDVPAVSPLSCDLYRLELANGNRRDFIRIDSAESGSRTTASADSTPRRTLPQRTRISR